MDRLQLEVSIREGTGKGPNRRLRAQGAIPAVVYGLGSRSVSLQVDERLLDRVLRTSSNPVIDLLGPVEVKGRLVLLKECQRDPVTRRVVHCDFYQVDTSKTIQVAVPLRLEGKSHGVEMGGVLEPLLREIEVSCLPLAIPDSLSIDVSELEIGDARHASDLVLPEGVELVTEETASIVHVIAPRVEEEEAPAEEEVAVEGEPTAEGAPAAEGEKPAEESSGD